jgi:hypothetical protein
MATPTTLPEHVAVYVTESLRVSSSGDTIHLGHSGFMAGGEYWTAAIIMTPDIARSVAAALITMARHGRSFEPVESVGLPLYRCLGVCGHVGTSEAEMAAHHAEAHEGER